MTTPRRTRRPPLTRPARRTQAGLALAALAGLCAGLSTFPARADDGPSPGDPPERLSIEEIAAHAAARAALTDLKLGGSTTQRDYRIAQEVLAACAALVHTAAERQGPGRPDEQTILRLQLEAAQGAGDAPTVEAISRRLVALEPRDAASVLRVISAAIGRLQTADERLAAYDRFVGEEGEGIDPAVRSRLALDSALLLRERGDVRAFGDRLYAAWELDKTNKDAATLLHAFYAQNGGDAAGRFDMLLNVLWADPFDPDVYGAVVRELLDAAAYRGAARFAAMQRRLLDQAGRSPDPAEDLAFDLARWNSAGPDALIRDLSDIVERSRADAARLRRDLEAQGRPADAVPRPEDLRLGFERERSRVLAAAAIGDRERVQAFMAELSETARRDLERFVDPARRPPGMDEQAGAAAANDLLAELAWLRLWTGVGVDQAATDLDRLRAAGALPAGDLDRCDAWLSLRRGAADARARLSTLAPSDPYALLGLAAMDEAAGDRNSAADGYAQAAARAPGGLAGAYARTRFGALRGRAPELGEGADALEAAAAELPQWVEVMVQSPRQQVSLEVTPLRSEISPLERTPVRVRVRNSSPIPLAVGPDKPVNSRLLFAPTVDVGSIRFPSVDLVEVVSLERRLRLVRDEDFEVVCWPDLTSLSAAMEVVSPRTTRVRWRALQGFGLSGDRLYEACAHCGEAELPPLMRRLPSRHDAVYEALRFSLQTGGPRELAETVLALKLQLAQGAEIPPQDRDRLMELLTRRYESLTKPGKVLMLSLLPPQGVLPETVRIDQRAADETDEDVLAVFIALRASRIDDPSFTAPAVTRSPRLGRLADLVRSRLQDKRPTVATVGWPSPVGLQILARHAQDRPGARDGTAPPGGAAPDGTAAAPPPAPPPPRPPTIPPDLNPVPQIP